MQGAHNLRTFYETINTDTLSCLGRNHEWRIFRGGIS
jgi:hypothetical protein